MAVTNNAVVGVALNYLQANPDETDDVRPLVVLALHGPPVVMASTMPAHVTCGVVAVTSDWQMLELHPSATRRLRLPTGFVEPTDQSLLGASLRLLTEQAGVPSEVVTPHAIVPLDVAAVPVAAKGSQPEHVHFDVRFLLQVPRDHVKVPRASASGSGGSGGAGGSGSGGGSGGGGGAGGGRGGGRSPGHRWVPVAEVPGRLGDKLRQAARVRA